MEETTTGLEHEGLPSFHQVQPTTIFTAEDQPRRHLRQIGHERFPFILSVLDRTHVGPRAVSYHENRFVEEIGRAVLREFG